MVRYDIIWHDMINQSAIWYTKFQNNMCTAQIENLIYNQLKRWNIQVCKYSASKSINIYNVYVMR